MSAVMSSSSAPNASGTVPQRASASTAATATAPEPGEKNTPSVGSAIERLALSRAQLRAAMLPAPRTSSSGVAGGIQSMAARLVDKVRAAPAAGMVIDTLETWWEQHPLRTASLVGAEVARKVTAPLAERNPLLLVGGAVVFGALIAMTRPWRWLLRPALFAGLLPALAATAIKQLPIDTLLRVFGTDRSDPVPTRSAARAAFDDVDPAAALARQERASSVPTATESVSALP